MWYPEEPVAYCGECNTAISVDCVWRGRGTIMMRGGKEVRARVLYSVCPECGIRRSVALEGPWWFRLLYSWLWNLRYPNTRPPHMERATPYRLRRASGE
ncbi:MAG TPA: hypothetical protein VK689_05620 [Armatimonadota bacterium]|nr:hypothetical protein [Armatimonadota bacterium]